MKHHCKEKRRHIPLQIIIEEDRTEQVTSVDYKVVANSKSSKFIQNTNLKLMMGALGLSSGVGNSNL